MSGAYNIFFMHQTCYILPLLSLEDLQVLGCILELPLFHLHQCMLPQMAGNLFESKNIAFNLKVQIQGQRKYIFLSRILFLGKVCAFVKQTKSNNAFHTIS